MKIAIHGMSVTEEAIAFARDIFSLLEEKKLSFSISEVYANDLDKAGFELDRVSRFSRGDDLSSFDFILSLGGDGTILDTITYTGQSELPIVGINIGRLGFLATTPKDEVSKAIDNLQNGHYKIQSRSLIHVDSAVGLFEPFNFGLNEFTIVKRETSSMIVVHTYVDDEYLNSYWADGLIVSTPTGSTGYSLSCGGPLMYPTLKSFIITPVSPHNLNVRPIIVSDQSVITFKIEGRSRRFMVSLDSRSSSIDDSVKISVRREVFEAKLVQFEAYRHFDTLRQKLNWGLDMRN